MKSMQLPLAAIFFMTNFYRTIGAMVPSPPPLDPLLQLKSVYNSPFKDSHSHPIHTCLSEIASNVKPICV